MPIPIEDFLTVSEEQDVIEAIRIAEENTSGEIRVHIENSANGDLNHRALEVFATLKMHNTRLRNGVLIYVAVKDRAFAIYGDQGINNVVPDDFWDSTKSIIESDFKNGAFSKGLVAGIKNAGQQLKAHFPVDDENPDELSNEISSII